MKTEFQLTYKPGTKVMVRGDDWTEATVVDLSEDYTLTYQIKNEVYKYRYFNLWIPSMTNSKSLKVYPKGVWKKLFPWEYRESVRGEFDIIKRFLDWAKDTEGMYIFNSLNAEDFLYEYLDLERES